MEVHLDIIDDDDIVDIFENPLQPQPIWGTKFSAFQPKHIELDNMQYDFFDLQVILFERYCVFKKLQAETGVSLYKLYDDDEMVFDGAGDY